MRSASPADQSHGAGAQRAAWIAALVLTAARLWLGTGLAIFAIPGSFRDDALYLSLANEILEGRWLGAYDTLTLAKGPFYPMWIAATAAAGVPLLLAQQLLYVAACAAFVAALAPALPGRWARVVLYIALLFQPTSYAAGVVTRVVREGTYPAFVLLLMAAAAGTALRATSRRRAILGGALAGLALAAVWLTREEGVWVLPGLALLAVAPFVWPLPRPPRSAWATAVGTAVLVFLAGWAAVAATNARHYGVFAVNDMSGGGAFPRAYGALGRVYHSRSRPLVPVPREARFKIYPQSPSFRELAPFIERPDFARGWVASSCQVIGVCDDIGGGWFGWALRDATQLAGHATSGAKAALFWEDLAREVNLACDEGRLACGPPRASAVEPWRSEHAPRLAMALARALGAIAWPSGLGAIDGPSGFDPLDPGPYRLLEGQRFLVERTDDLRTDVLDGLPRAWAPVQLAALVAGLVAFLAAGVLAWRRLCRPDAAWMLAGALLAAVGARAAVIAYVDATSFPAVNALYLAPAYPLAIAFAVLSTWSAWAALTGAQEPLTRRTTQWSEPPNTQSSGGT